MTYSPLQMRDKCDQKILTKIGKLIQYSARLILHTTGEEREKTPFRQLEANNIYYYSYYLYSLALQATLQAKVNT